MLDRMDIRLSELLRIREEPHQPPKRPVLQLDVPWPWPWVLLETACPWWFPEEVWQAGKQTRRRVPRVPSTARGALVAVRAVTPADLPAGLWLEERGVSWPSCPDSWRGALVAVGELTEAQGLCEDASPWWRRTWPWAWEFSGLVPVEPLQVPPILRPVGCDGHYEAIGAHQLAPVDPDVMPELRERWCLSRWGCYRYSPLASWHSTEGK